MTRTLTILILAVLVSGCAVSTDEGILVAGARTGETETQVRDESNLPRTIAVLPFLNQTKSEFAYDVVRRTISNHVSTKNYRMLHWRDVDNRLQLAGLDTPEDVAQMGNNELRQILGVDGLVRGNITHYNKTFAGIYSQIAVGVELSMTNVGDEVVWEVKDVRRSHSGGASTNPVGLLMNALVAAKHLYGDINLYRAADDLGRDLAKDMPEPASLSQRAKPGITNVVHSGVGQFLKYGDTLEIGIEGDAGLTAVADIDGIGLVDLEEVEPGQYVGKVALDASTNVTDIAVVGRLQDDFGQTATWVSQYGLLNVDNEAPAAVSEVSIISRDGALDVAWTSGMSSDVAGYRVALATTETGAAGSFFESSDSNLTVEPVPNFQMSYISVTAFDAAGNESEPVKIAGIAAPDTRFSDADDLPSSIPDRITGTYRMTAEGNPYYLRNATTVTGDGVLLVGPGVEIVVSPSAKLSVLGEMHTFGNSDHWVTVSASEGNSYDEFLVLQGKGDTSISGLMVTGAGIPIQVMAGSPTISDCILKDSAFNALTIDGSARPVLRGNTFEGAKASGVVVSGQSQPTFSGNKFVNNDPFHLQNGSTYQLDLSDNEFEPAASAMTVLGDVQL